MFAKVTFTQSMHDHIIDDVMVSHAVTIATVPSDQLSNWRVCCHTELQIHLGSKDTERFAREFTDHTLVVRSRGGPDVEVRDFTLACLLDAERVMSFLQHMGEGFCAQLTVGIYELLDIMSSRCMCTDECYLEKKCRYYRKAKTKAA